jgi:hypothetical protein
VFHVSFDFSIGFDRGKQDVVQKPIQELVGIKAELRARRFNELQQQITDSVQSRVVQHNAQSNAALYLASDLSVTESGSEIVISANSNAPRNLVIKFKPADSEVRIKSDRFDHTIQVWNIEPASTGLVYRQKGARSWSVLDNAESVERMIERAFLAMFS